MRLLVWIWVVGVAVGVLGAWCEDSEVGVSVCKVKAQKVSVQPIIKGEYIYMFHGNGEYEGVCAGGVFCEKMTQDGKSAELKRVGDPSKSSWKAKEEGAYFFQAEGIATGTGAGVRALEMEVKCAKETSLATPLVKENPATHNSVYQTVLKSNSAGVCKYAPGGDTDSFIMRYPFSIGWTILLCILPLIFCVAFWYIVIGIIVKIKVYHVPIQPVSLDLMPNKGFWVAWPFMIKDAHVFIVMQAIGLVKKLVEKIKGLRKGSYEEV